MKSAHILAE
jgi:hypothetical protein